MTKTKPRLSREDTRAMAQAIAAVRVKGRASREQIDEKLASEDWEAVGRFAAYVAQDNALRLKPWEMPPCWIRDLDASLQQPPDDHRGEHRAAVLLKRLLAAGLSRYEPNPLAALAAIEENA
jgi:hypothetical protein